MKINVERKNGKGRTIIKWLDNIKNDMKPVVVCIKDVKRDKWDKDDRPQIIGKKSKEKKKKKTSNSMISLKGTVSLGVCFFLSGYVCAHTGDLQFTTAHCNINRCVY